MYSLSQVIKIMGDKTCLKEVTNGRAVQTKKACTGHFNDRAPFESTLTFDAPLGLKRLIISADDISVAVGVIIQTPTHAFRALNCRLGVAR